MKMLHIHYAKFFNPKKSFVFFFNICIMPMKYIFRNNKKNFEKILLSIYLFFYYFFFVLLLKNGKFCLIHETFF